MSGVSLGLGGGFGSGGAGSGPFDPAEVEGLVWWDAADAEVSSADGKVIAWPTRSSGGQVLVPTEAGREPLRVANAINDRTALGFDRIVPRELSLSGGMAGTAEMLVAVVQLSANLHAGIGGNTLIRVGSGATTPRLALGNAHPHLTGELVSVWSNAAGASSASYVDSIELLPPGTRLILVARKAATPTGWEIRLNGRVVSQRFAAGAMPAAALDAFFVGSNGNSAGFTGLMAAVGVSTSSDLALARTIEAFCAARWGIPLLAEADTLWIAALGQSLAMHLATRDQPLSKLQSHLRVSLGRPFVLGLNLAVGGSAVLSAADPVQHWWDTTADAPGPLLTQAVQAAQALSVTPGAAFWRVGEKDSAFLADNPAEADLWKASLKKAIDHFRAVLGDPAMPTLLVPIGRRAVAQPGPGIQSIRVRERALPDEMPGVYLTPDIYDLPLAPDDSVHLSDGGYTTMAERLAGAIERVLKHDTAPVLGPRTVAAERVGDNVIDVRLAHGGGTDIAPASGIQGFTVLENGTPRAIATAVRTSPSTVQLALEAPLAAGSTVQLASAWQGPAGGAFDNAWAENVLRDDALPPLPLQPGLVTVGLWTPLSLGSALAGWWSMKGTGVLYDGPTAYAGDLQERAAMPAQASAWSLQQVDDLSGRSRHASAPASARMTVNQRLPVFKAGKGLGIAHHADFNPSSGIRWYVVLDLPAGDHVAADHVLGKGNGINGPAGYHFNWSVSGGVGSLTGRATHDGATQLNRTVYFDAARPRAVIWLGFYAALGSFHAGSVSAAGDWDTQMPLASYDNALPVLIGGSAALNMDGGRFCEAVAVSGPTASQHAALLAFLRSRWSA